jgi:hypothetical protein
MREDYLGFPKMYIQLWACLIAGWKITDCLTRIFDVFAIFRQENRAE